MFGLDHGETLAVISFAVTMLGGVAGVLVQVGRVLQKLTQIEHRLHDHEMRLRAVEWQAGISPPASSAKVVSR